MTEEFLRMSIAKNCPVLAHAFGFSEVKFLFYTGLKVNNQLVAFVTRFLVVCLKNHVWSHHRTLKAKVQCDFSSTYSPDHTNVLRLINININVDITQPGTK